MASPSPRLSPPPPKPTVSPPPPATTPSPPATTPPPPSRFSPPPPATTSPPEPIDSPPPPATTPPPPSRLSPPPPEPIDSPPPDTTSPPPSRSPPPPPATKPPPPEPVDSPTPPATTPPPPSRSPPPPPATTPPPPEPIDSPPPPDTTPPPPEAVDSPPPPNTTPPPPPPDTTPPPPSSSPPPPPGPIDSPPPPVTTTPPPSRSPPPPPATKPPPPEPIDSPFPPFKSPPPPPATKPPPPEPIDSPPPPSKSLPPPPATAPPPPQPAVSPPPPATTPRPPSRSPPPPPPPSTSHPPPPSTKAPPRKPPRRSPPSPFPPPPPPPRSRSPPTSPQPPSIIKPPPPPSIRSAPFHSPPGTPSNGIPRKPNVSSSGSDWGIGFGGKIAIAVACGLLVLSFVGALVCCLRKRRRRQSSQPNADRIAQNPNLETGSIRPSYEPIDLGNAVQLFNYEQLERATNGFSEENLLGEGGFGCVYKGVLEDGKDVAVKRLSNDGGQGEREFMVEVEIISRIHHRHLVALVGYCIEENRRLLVYDYVCNNSLHFHLHGEGRPVLDWASRVKISVGAARGIAYLHHDCDPGVIHRDIKSANILLDSNFDARVGDFGMAKSIVDSASQNRTRVVGTVGYLAPEYASTGNPTTMSDVFSFGVVLLELITGRKAVDKSDPLSPTSLVEWAKPLLPQALETGETGILVDPRLGGQYVQSEMLRVIETAAACLRSTHTRRPNMGLVARKLDSTANIDLNDGETETLNSPQMRWLERMAFGRQDDIGTSEISEIAE